MLMQGCMAGMVAGPKPPRRDPSASPVHTGGTPPMGMHVGRRHGPCGRAKSLLHGHVHGDIPELVSVGELLCRQPELLLAHCSAALRPVVTPRRLPPRTTAWSSCRGDPLHGKVHVPLPKLSPMSPIIEHASNNRLRTASNTAMTASHFSAACSDPRAPAGLVANADPTTCPETVAPGHNHDQRRRVDISNQKHPGALELALLQKCAGATAHVGGKAHRCLAAWTMNGANPIRVH